MNSGREFQTAGTKTEGSSTKNLKREVRTCQQRYVKRMQHPRGIVWMKVREMYCGILLWQRQAILYWILAFIGSQQSILNSDVACACLGLQKTSKASWFCMHLSFFSLLLRRSARKGLQQPNLESMKETASLVTASVERKEWIFPILCNWQNRIWHRCVICAATESVSSTHSQRCLSLSLPTADMSAVRGSLHYSWASWSRGFVYFLANGVCLAECSKQFFNKF